MATIRPRGRKPGRVFPSSVKRRSPDSSDKRFSGTAATGEEGSRVHGAQTVGLAAAVKFEAGLVFVPGLFPGQLQGLLLPADGVLVVPLLGVGGGERVEVRRLVPAAELTGAGGGLDR